MFKNCGNILFCGFDTEKDFGNVSFVDFFELVQVGISEAFIWGSCSWKMTTFFQIQKSFDDGEALRESFANAIWAQNAAICRKCVISEFRLWFLSGFYLFTYLLFYFTVLLVFSFIIFVLFCVVKHLMPLVANIWWPFVLFFGRLRELLCSGLFRTVFFFWKLSWDKISEQISCSLLRNRDICVFVFIRGFFDWILQFRFTRCPKYKRTIEQPLIVDINMNLLWNEMQYGTVNKLS